MYNVTTEAQEIEGYTVFIEHYRRYCGGCKKYKNSTRLIIRNNSGNSRKWNLSPNTYLSNYEMSQEDFDKKKQELVSM